MPGWCWASWRPPSSWLLRGELALVRRNQGEKVAGGGAEDGWPLQQGPLPPVQRHMTGRAHGQVGVHGLNEDQGIRAAVGRLEDDETVRYMGQYRGGKRDQAYIDVLQRAQRGN